MHRLGSLCLLDGYNCVELKSAVLYIYIYNIIYIHATVVCHAMLLQFDNQRRFHSLRELMHLM